MARRKKTGLPGPVWRKLFGGIARYCAQHRSPNEPMNVCVKRVWSQFKTPEGKVNVSALQDFLAKAGITVPA